MTSNLVYRPEKGIEENLSLDKVLEYLKDKSTLAWLDFTNPTEDDYQVLLKDFGFHPLAVEDCKTQFHLPKIDDYESYLFLVWHAMADNPKTAKIETTEIDIFLEKNFLISLHEKKVANIESVFQEFLKRTEDISRGVVWILHRLLDSMVGDYFPLVDRISNEIDLLEDKIFEDPSQSQLRKLFMLKHQMLSVRKIAAPEREIINVLSGGGSQLVEKGAYFYFQDIYDHLIRIVDMVDTARDVIGGAMDIYLSTLSNKTNEVMKKLTVVATIFMPATLITSLYGMNFKYMPELEFRYGYLMVWVAIFGFGLGMFIYFRRKGWW